MHSMVTCNQGIVLQIMLALQKNWQRMIDEGLRAQREHIDTRCLPGFLKNAVVLKVLRRAFQARRVTKRLLAHGRLM